VGSWRQAVRFSMTGHGWIAWASCVGALLSAVLGWLAPLVGLTLIELVAVASLIAQQRRMRRGPG
jgi:uncharacterized membrane protein HdeD (DUF308 family)